VTDVAGTARRASLRRLPVLSERISHPLLQLSALVAIIVAWQLASDAAGQGILPGPATTLPVFLKLVSSGRFVDPLIGSFGRTLAGFVLSFAAGVAWGLAAGRSPRFDHITSLLFQVALFANTLVVILWGLAILGNTNPAAVVLITGIAVFPNIAVYMRDVVKTTDIEVLEMADAYRAGRLSRILDVYLPFIAPPMLACARIGFSLSWKIVLLSEVFGFPSGIGWAIRQAYTGYNLALVISWLVVFIITLLIVEQIIRLIELRTIRWQ
jgi:NitT/TauT family transport system permease protein